MVIGAGAAGLAGAAVLGRCGRKVLVVGDRDRANTTAAEVHNLPYAEGVAPDALYQAMETELSGLGVPVFPDEVRAVVSDESSGFLSFTVGSAAVTAARLLLATGAHHELPDWVPDGSWGTSVFECPFCHALEHAGEDFVVVGRGVPALQVALLCLDRAGTMTVLVADRGASTGPTAQRLRDRGGEVVVDSVEKAAARPDGSLSLTTFGGRTVAAGAVLLTGTLRPRTVLCDQLGLRMASYGIPELDDEGRSSHPSVWVAGMAARPQHMLVESMAGGVRAGVSIHKDLTLAGIPAE